MEKMGYGEFLDFAWGRMSQEQGHATLWQVRKPGGAPNLDHWYEYPNDLDSAIGQLTFNSDKDTYLSPFFYGDKTSPTTGHYSRDVANAQYGCTVFLDADAFDPRKCRIKPSLIVRTSKHDGETHWQAWWKLNTYYSSERIANAIRKIARAHQDDGCDPTSFNRAKLMRVPGSHNTKRGEPYDPVVVESYDPNDSHELAEFEDAYSDIVVDDLTIERNAIGAGAEVGEIDYDNLPTAADVLAKLPNDRTDIIDMATSKVDGSRSELRQKLMLTLIETGLFTDEEIIAVTAAAPCGEKWQETGLRDGLPMPEWELARMKAYHLLHPTGSEDIDAFDWDGEIDVETGELLAPKNAGDSLATNPGIEILTSEDRHFAQKSHDNFINHYLSYTHDEMGDKVNEPYNRLAALLLLAATIGQYGFLPKSSSTFQPLNIYGIAIGQSSSGKSISKSLLQAAIDRVCARDGYSPVIGSDVAPGTLQAYVYDMNGNPVIYEQDEAAGLFKQVTGRSGGYLTGLFDVLTDMYDGRVTPAIRSGDTHAKSAPANLSLFFMSTPDNIMQSMDLSMFESGFLARMLWVVGDRVEMTEDSFVYNQPKNIDLDGKNRSVPTFAIESILSDAEQILIHESGGVAQKPIQNLEPEYIEDADGIVEKNNTHSVNFHPDRKPMEITPEAISLMAKAFKEINDKAHSHRLYEIALKSAIVRMGDTAVRAACLLALANGTYKVTRKYMVFALNEVELWFRGLMYAAEHVSESQFARACKEIIDTLKQKPGQKMTIAEIYRLQDNVQAGIVDQRIDTLERQGKIIRENAGDGGVTWVKLRIKGR